MISEMLVQATGTPLSVGVYIIGTAVVSFAAVSAIPETRGNDLGVTDADPVAAASIAPGATPGRV